MGAGLQVAPLGLQFPPSPPQHTDVWLGRTPLTSNTHVSLFVFIYFQKHLISAISSITKVLVYKGKRQMYAQKELEKHRLLEPEGTFRDDLVQLTPFKRKCE